MKRYSLLLAVLLSFLVIDPAGAWFWEKKEVKPPEVSRKTMSAAEHKAEGQGFLARLEEAGRDVLGYFRGTGLEVKQIAKKAPGEIKEGAKETGRSLKEGGRELKHEARQFPGKAKEAGREIGQGFKQLGRDIKGTNKKALKD